MSTAPLDLATLLLNGRDAGKHYADLATALTGATVRQTITGASTVDLTIADAKRTLVQSKALTERARIVLDDAGYTLVKVAKSGARVTLTFEDDAVAELRKHDSYRKAAANTTTRTGFVTSLIREVPDLRVVVAPAADKNLVELARGSGATASGPGTKEDTWTAAGRIMGEIGWRVFCYRGTITVAPDSWLLAHGTPYSLAPDSPGVHDIDFSWDVGKPAATATITADAGFRDLAPGAPVTLSKLGIGNGRWLVESIDRNPFSKTVTVSAVRPQPVIPEPTDSSGSGDFGIPAFLKEYLGDPNAAAASAGFQSTPTAVPGGVSLSAADKLLGKAGQFVSVALSKKGLPYVYGASGPAAFDCSGFLQWCAGQVGVSFPKPVSNQAARCRAAGTTMTVSQAAYTRGAVIWHEYGGGANDHIVISLGDGKNTIEAMGSAYGVRVGNIEGRSKPWTGAGWVPGIPVTVPGVRDLRPG